MSETQSKQSQPGTLSGMIKLGRTRLEVGHLGIASSYGAPASAYQEAFERGCNYFTWGTFIRGRSKSMAEAVRNIVKSGGRDKLVIAFLSYAHNAFLTEKFLIRGLRGLGLDFADVLLLGYFPRRPARGILEGALELRNRGLIRHVGLTGHNRKLFPDLSGDSAFGVFHIRYNPVHRGAEIDLFPHLTGEGRPGVVAFTATRWGCLLSQDRMPPGERAPTAADCYRFVLSHPAVDVCMTGPRTAEQMRENLTVLEKGPMTDSELERMRRIGDFLYKKK